MLGDEPVVVVPIPESELIKFNEPRPIPLTIIESARHDEVVTECSRFPVSMRALHSSLRHRHVVVPPTMRSSFP